MTVQNDECRPEVGSSRRADLAGSNSESEPGAAWTDSSSESESELGIDQSNSRSARNSASSAWTLSRAASLAAMLAWAVRMAASA
jgi:hypothetical protein